MKKEVKKGNLPTQRYELISVTMQTMETGTPLTCDDCGRLIFNIAVIKGVMDGKTYNVGLTCVKKLLNTVVYFDCWDEWELERKENEWKRAMNALKWLKNREKEGLYTFKYVELSEGKEFRFDLIYKKDYHGMKEGWQGGYSATLEADKLPLFKEYINE